jgi:hypothetical protein
MDQFYANIDRHIATLGRSILGVMGEGEHLGFSYTIGNHKADLPELLVIGLEPRTAGQLLNWMSDEMKKRGQSFENGELVNWGGEGKLALKFVRAGRKARDEYTIQATRYLETEDYGLMQILVPDTEGRYPDEPGCAPPYGTVPVLTE